MFASVSRTAWCALALAWLCSGCGDPARYRFGTNVTGLLFAPVSSDEGVHPSLSVMQDPDNLFTVHPLGAQTKWELLEAGAPVAAFYAFATGLARGPTGEDQYYAARMLADISGAAAVKHEADRERVRDMAIRAFQAQLDHFPDARGYDATGTVSWRLATLSYRGIEALGGTVKGDWVLLPSGEGTVEAVHATAGTP
jgi:hypothetical protein